jgi:CRP/FNR family cyclic AMP-dependent transcriptional regulator
MSTPTYLALASTPLLAGLTPSALLLLEQEGVLHSFAAQEPIVREGQEGHSFFILMEGDVEVVKNCGAVNEVLLARLHRGTFFGEMCVVDPVPRAATVCTVTPVTAIEIKASTLYHLFRQMPDQYAIVILNLARDMARRLRTLDEAFAARAC